MNISFNVDCFFTITNNNKQVIMACFNAHVLIAVNLQNLQYIILSCLCKKNLSPFRLFSKLIKFKLTQYMYIILFCFVIGQSPHKSRSRSKFSGIVLSSKWNLNNQNLTSIKIQTTTSNTCNSSTIIFHRMVHGETFW